MTDATNILELAEDSVIAGRRADMLYSEKLNIAIRAGCSAADIHLVCSYPDCRCKQTPRMVKAVLASWEAKPSSK